MKTRLSEDGKIGIPEQIRNADHLRIGDLFNLERLSQGYYLLAKQKDSPPLIEIVTAEDGLPIIRTKSGVISSAQVKELESQGL